MQSSHWRRRGRERREGRWYGSAASLWNIANVEVVWNLLGVELVLQGHLNDITSEGHGAERGHFRAYS